MKKIGLMPKTKNPLSIGLEAIGVAFGLYLAMPVNCALGFDVLRFVQLFRYFVLLRRYFICFMLAQVNYLFCFNVCLFAFHQYFQLP